MRYVYPLGAVFLWGGNTVVTKLSSGVLAPSEISFLRWLIAIFVLSPIAIKGVIENRQVIRQNLLKLSALGFLSGVVYQCLAYYAAHFTSAMHMGLIQALMPSFAIFLAVFVLKENASYFAFTGATVALLGVLIVLTNGDLYSLRKNSINAGDVIMLIATFSMALYNILLTKWKIKIPLIQSLYIQAIASAIILLPFYYFAQKSEMSVSSVSITLYSGILASVVAPLLWMKGNEYLGPSTNSFFYTLLPIISIIMSVALLSEKINASYYVGTIFSVLGIFIGGYKHKKNRI